ncbi:sigma-54-dependent Fis family transcriptional regulator [Moraxella osloensis]|uniref:Sigma-54-dependent Fis family transcriptional regulator n=1 Tax=Faucicola osloensis TaxID=34062 RepID=A0AAD0EX92_FAUOS|nr:sigma-54 dependent transcriptional regulator [Moraxella osloensis]ATQ83327.1 sigma-54-dependent Fis family transcriptional regulator [Moraxella osloensis]ATW85821.1 sigma-54-dependent Fis family transcriptional regulator [Moraxella osloensis]
MSLALIIDDEVDLCRLMQMTLKKMGIESKVAYDYATGISHLQAYSFDFCLTDLKLPDGTGLDIVKFISKNYAKTPVAVITAHGSMDLAIEALKLGAFDFVNKPLELSRLRQLVENALKVAENANKLNCKEVYDPFSNRLIGHSNAIAQLKTTIQKLARSQAPVFLWGESGTGKEVVAKLIHDLSPRCSANFVPVNCGAIPSELMESEFFGHIKGSFTGATADKEGLFQQANGGTLFLDEVADLPISMQVKLLRAIQEKKIRPIGSTQEIAVDVRLLSATHKNLAKLVETGEFRQDLYYRINVIEVKLPSLNERRDDILLLANHFISLIADDWGLAQPLTLSNEAAVQLANHHFAGNVRELRNILERAITLADDNVIEAHHLNLPLSAANVPPDTPRIHEIQKTHEITETPNQSVLSIPSQPSAPKVAPLAEAKSASNSPINTSYSSNLFASGYKVKPNIQLAPTPTQSNHEALTHEALTLNAPIGGINAPNLAQPAAEEGQLPAEGLEEYLMNQERKVIIAALNCSGWNRTQAAKLLNTTFRSLRYRMKKLGIDSGSDINSDSDSDED